MDDERGKTYDADEIASTKAYLLEGLVRVVADSALLETWKEKLADYRAIVNVDDFRVGSYVRYINFRNANATAAAELKLVAGGVLVGVVEQQQQGEEAVGGGGGGYYVHLRSIGLGSLWTMAFSDCVFFQKFSKEETIILRALLKMEK